MSISNEKILTQLLRNQISLMCFLNYSNDDRAKLELRAALKSSLKILEELRDAP